ncbi:MAG: hypothetical protein ACXABY_15905 [Candidatus Thorarchaeota archaeon]|jgi:hypothetical protein
MTIVTGEVRGEAGPVIDTSHTGLPATFFAGQWAQSDFNVQTNGHFKNTGNVDQTLTVPVTNLTGIVTSVGVDVGNGTNVIVMSPGQEVTPTFAVTATVPATPGPDEPAVIDTYSFEIVDTWS